MGMQGSAERTARVRTGWLIGAARAAADALLPPACFACDAPVQTQGLLCAACFPRFTFITAPQCHCCGLPFSHAEAAVEGGLCQACLDFPPVYDRARAAWLYDDASSPVLLGFKYGDRTEHAPAIARAMFAAGTVGGAGLLAEADVIAPVPLHRWRLVTRRFNQAAMLAARVGKQAGVPVLPHLLRRLRHTPRLAERGARERAAVLAGAVAVNPRLAPLIADRRVLLIDDVLTSGATANACAAALFAAGAAGVDVLTAARTPPAPRQSPLDGEAAPPEVLAHG